MRPFSIVLFVLFFWGLIGCSKPNDPEFYKESINRGNILITAIEKYKDKNKTYPKNLKILAPKYIKNVPTSNINNMKFIYHIDPNTEDYSLAIIIEPSGLMVLSAKAIKRLSYNPYQTYTENNNTKTHFIYNGWALQTMSRSN